MKAPYIFRSVAVGGEGAGDTFPFPVKRT